MKTSLTSILSAGFTLLLSISPGFASTIGFDNATNYGGGWTSGTNGGTGFGAWTISSTTTNTSGTATLYASNYIGDSSGVLGSTNVNTAGNTAFALYANPGSGGYGAGDSALSDAYRYFAGGALSPGQTFSLQIGVNYRNGNKGIDIFSSGTNIFNLNIGADTYVVNNTTTNSGHLFSDAFSSDTVFTIQIEQTTLTSGTWVVTRSGGLTGTASGTYTGDADQFHLYCDNTDNSQNNVNNLFANNFTIVPEPSSIALILASIGTGSVYLARRKRH